MSLSERASRLTKPGRKSDICLALGCFESLLRRVPPPPLRQHASACDWCSSALAVPRLIVLKDAANQGQVESMAAALHQAAITGHVRCELLPACAATTKTGFGFVT